MVLTHHPQLQSHSKRSRSIGKPGRSSSARTIPERPRCRPGPVGHRSEAVEREFLRARGTGKTPRRDFNRTNSWPSIRGAKHLWRDCISGDRPIEQSHNGRHCAIFLVVMTASNPGPRGMRFSEFDYVNRSRYWQRIEDGGEHRTLFRSRRLQISFLPPMSGLAAIVHSAQIHGALNETKVGEGRTSESSEPGDKISGTGQSQWA